MATFPSSVVTPERILVEREVEAVMLRTVDGEITFLAGHSPLVGVIVPGLVRLQAEDGSVERLAVHGGFVEVGDRGVTVLAPIAELATEIDVERARRALEQAEARLSELQGSGRGSSEEQGGQADREVAAAEDDRRRAQVRVEVAAG